MPAFGPISRRELVRALRRAGFEGPFAGARHDFMRRDDVTVRVPNPHRGDISQDLLARVLRQVGLSREEWEAL